jgi:MOSC domain-containing protein YiiM
MEPLTRAELDAGLDHVLASPTDRGAVELVVARPGVGDREVLEQGELDPTVGLVGDTWIDRRSRHTPDGSPNPVMQVTLMNARAAALVAQDIGRWPLAGDQLYVDLELGYENVPAGTRLQVGTAVVEISDEPHTGCAKFAERFGMDAVRFVNSPVGRAHNLRGVNARVIVGGVVRPGDPVHKVVGDDA